MTTFNAMPQSLIKAAIIGVLLALMSGCSTLRLAYGNGSQLAWWWLDGYVDFSSEQSPRAKESIDRFFAWHRATQLADYIVVLGQAQAQVLEPVSPATACRWQQLLRDRVDPALERAIDQFTDLVPGLGEAQFRHLDQRFAKNRGEMRRDYLQPKPDDRHQAAVDRVVERAEQLYGRIGDAQRQVIAAGVAASPFDAQAWLAERERRQRDTVATLRRLVADRADRDETGAALRVLVERAERSPDPAYREYQVRLNDYNCAFAARVHNSTTPAQREAARERLKGWEDDLRSLLVTQRPAEATASP